MFQCKADCIREPSIQHRSECFLRMFRYLRDYHSSTRYLSSGQLLWQLYKVRDRHFVRGANKHSRRVQVLFQPQKHQPPIYSSLHRRLYVLWLQFACFNQYPKQRNKHRDICFPRLHGTHNIKLVRFPYINWQFCFRFLHQSETYSYPQKRNCHRERHILRLQCTIGNQPPIGHHIHRK